MAALEFLAQKVVLMLRIVLPFLQVAERDDAPLASIVECISSLNFIWFLSTKVLSLWKVKPIKKLCVVERLIFKLAAVII